MTKNTYDYQCKCLHDLDGLQARSFDVDAISYGQYLNTRKVLPKSSAMPPKSWGLGQLPGPPRPAVEQSETYDHSEPKTRPKPG
jgi:hypothetical protein